MNNIYRGITLLSVAMKAYEQIRPLIENTLELIQSSFRKGIQDHIFTVKQLIEKSLKQEECLWHS